MNTGTIIIVSFYAVFLLVFLSTALVALGGVLKVWHFKNVDAAYTKWLMAALLLELIAAVILTYKNLPKPDWESTQPFSLQMEYVDYVDDWKKSLKKPDIDCLEIYNRGYSPKPCVSIISSFEKVKSVIGERGEGDIYLQSSNGPNREGNALYLFPGESVKIVMNVTGHQEPAGIVSLNFKQPKRYIKQDNGVFIERPETAFTINFTQDKNNLNIYRGILFHPQIKVNGNRLKLANAILIRKAL